MEFQENQTPLKSQRLGLDESIIENARSLVETDNIKFEDMLTEIEKNER